MCTLCVCVLLRKSVKRDKCNEKERHRDRAHVKCPGGQYANHVGRRQNVEENNRREAASSSSKKKTKRRMRSEMKLTTRTHKRNSICRIWCLCKQFCNNKNKRFTVDFIDEFTEFIVKNGT